MTSTEVVIAGGGPVGMTLAHVLANYGVSSVLLERNPTTTLHPKMDITNARSMELFRRVGLDEKLRAVAVDEDNPFDVSWITRLNGYELHRFEYEGAAGVRRRMKEQNDGSQPSQPPMRVSQVLIEPVLKQAIEDHPLVDVRFGHAFDAFEETPDGVACTFKRPDGSTGVISAKWLVGCDGGASTVRTQMGIGLSGRARVSNRFITHFRSTDTRLLQRWGKAWHYQSNLGTLVAQNDKDTWTLLTRFPEGVAFENVDPSALLTEFAGEPVEHEILVCNSWAPHLLVADSYGRGRVWLAGDSVHQVIPTGGYGMNTGIGDAYDIGWKLAAVIKGFGGPRLLESYEQERRPVGLANCGGSGRHNDVRVANAILYANPDLERNDAAGEAARREVGAKIAEHGNAENEAFGLEMGYSYHASPIVCPDPSHMVPQDPFRYTPSTSPGARLPSVYLEDGSNIHDQLGDWFTLLCFEEMDCSAIVEAAGRLDVPVDVKRIDVSAWSDLYRGPALLVRPDQHIAWRGSPPTDVEAASLMLKRCLGFDIEAQLPTVTVVT